MDVVRYSKEKFKKVLKNSSFNLQSRIDPLEINNQGRKVVNINQNPFVLITLPRSGTHWLRQMLEALPGISPPSTPDLRIHLDPIALDKVIQSEPRSTLICDHLFFSVCAQPLYDYGIQPILLFRDPRDVLISQMYALYKDIDLDVQSPSIWKPLLEAMVFGKKYNLPDRGPHLFRSMRWRLLNQAVFWLDIRSRIFASFRWRRVETVHASSGFLVSL